MQHSLLVSNASVTDVKMTLWEDGFLSLSCLSIAGASSSPLVTMTILPSSLHQLLSHVDSGQKGVVFQPRTCQLQTGWKETIGGCLESHNAFEEHPTVVVCEIKPCWGGGASCRRSVSQELLCYWLQGSSEHPKPSLWSAVHLAAGPTLKHHLTHIEVLASERARILPLKD